MDKIFGEPLKDVSDLIRHIHEEKMSVREWLQAKNYKQEYQATLSLYKARLARIKSLCDVDI